MESLLPAPFIILVSSLPFDVVFLRLRVTFMPLEGREEEGPSSRFEGDDLVVAAPGAGTDAEVLVPLL